MGRVGIVLLLVVAAVLFPACDPIEPCGTFDFEGTVDDGAGENSLPMSLAFDFDPAACGPADTCTLVAYVQIVRTVDMEDFTYLYPSSEKEDRATGNGWYIDRVAGKIWGYYGRNDNGSFASNLSPGSDTTDATLFDTPSRPEVEPWLDMFWQAVSVPVCLDGGSSYSDNLLGYYFWSWLVDSAGTATGPLAFTGQEFHHDEVDAAVGEWNAQAPGLGKNQFPAFNRAPP
jgi:hypothetical protein